MRVRDGRLEIEIANANLLRGRSEAKVTNDIEVLTKEWKPDIIGLQEASGYIDVLRRMKGDDYTVIVPRNANSSNRNTSILYNHAELRLVGSGARIAAAAIEGAKGMPARYVNWAHFKTRRGGNSIYHYNTHLNPHIEAGGRMREETPKRVASAKRQLNIFSEMVLNKAKMSQHRVFWSGDFNIDEFADNRVSASGFMDDTFDQYGLLSVYDELKTPSSFDTHGNRTIDIIGSHKTDGGVKALSVRRRNTGSDHHFVLATYRLAPAGDSPKDPTDPGTPTRGQEDPYEPLPGDWIENEEPTVPSTPAKPVERDNGSEIDHSDCCDNTYS